MTRKQKAKLLSDHLIANGWGSNIEIVSIKYYWLRGWVAVFKVPNKKLSTDTYTVHKMFNIILGSSFTQACILITQGKLLRYLDEMQKLLA